MKGKQEYASARARKNIPFNLIDPNFSEREGKNCARDSEDALSA